MTLDAHRISRPGMSWRWVALLFISLCAAMVGAFTLAQATLSTDAPISGPAGPTPGPGPLGVNPWGANGSTVTLSQLRADISPALPLPDSPLANSDNLGAIWENTATHAVAIYYPSSGIELVYGGTGVDYTGVSASDIRSIGGIRSVIIPVGMEDEYTHVLVPLPGNHLVTVVGAGPASDLTSVAASIVSNS